ncbi:MAG: hypothetical protein WBN22_01090 [Verrucomicrobiia bacterium]
MNIPIEIVAAILPLALGAVWADQRAIRKRISRTEKNVLILIIMLRDHGLKIPDEDDTKLFLKANNL